MEDRGRGSEVNLYGVYLHGYLRLYGVLYIIIYTIVAREDASYFGNGHLLRGKAMCYENEANWGAAPQLERAVLATAIYILSIVHLPIVHSLALALV